MTPDRQLPCTQQSKSGPCNEPAETATRLREPPVHSLWKPILIFTYFTTIYACFLQIVFLHFLNKYCI